jgi:hypothetical protein
MRPPTLSFACELDALRLTALFDDPSVLADLQALRARVVLMLSDYSAERAGVVQLLNGAGLPVVGVPLLPADQGYYFTPDNVPQARASYARFTDWTKEHGLRWDGVGLDIEPDVAVYWQVSRNPWGLVRVLGPRLADTARPTRARADYAALVERIHADGWPVENYQFSLIADERRAGSTLLQRVLGLVDVRTDRGVYLQYTSFMRGLGPGLLWSYGPEATAIAVGTTGGGPDVPDIRRCPPRPGRSSPATCAWPGTSPTRSTCTASRAASGRASSPAADLRLDARGGAARLRAAGRPAAPRPAHHPLGQRPFVARRRHHRRSGTAPPPTSPVAPAPAGPAHIVVSKSTRPSRECRATGAGNGARSGR